MSAPARQIIVEQTGDAMFSVRGYEKDGKEHTSSFNHISRYTWITSDHTIAVSLAEMFLARADMCLPAPGFVTKEM